MTTKLKFNTAQKCQFLATTRSRVDQYFKEDGLSRNANTYMWVKIGVFLTAFFSLYGLIISNLFSVWIMFPLVVLLGVFSAFVGFNICHDAIHKAFSSHAWVNKTFSFLFSLFCFFLFLSCGTIGLFLQPFRNWRF